MFIYEKNGAICVTFKDNKPVPTPDYVIVIDEDTKDVIINGRPYSQLVKSTQKQFAAKKQAATIVTKEEPEVKEETLPEVI